MNFDELWIGDLVWVKSRSKNGKWEGPADNSNARIRVGHMVLTVPFSDLSEARDERSAEEQKSTTRDDQAPKAKFDKKEIDLHINKLNPSLEFQTPQQIVLYQLRKCREFVEYAIEMRWFAAVIIHGKGSGALKSEVYHLLEDYGEVYHKVPCNNGGAVEVWFQYT